MSSYARFGLRAKLARNLSLIVPILIVSAVLVLIVPLPSALLDMLLAANIALSVVVLLTPVQVGTPLDFEGVVVAVDDHEHHAAVVAAAGGVR